ncbi:hypothetical protein [Saccharothrix lopnurensis]|uniref:DUF397 domain-containing protein n=1 Tax=Saccharothrix lopnurensis TaxID=1670621 RepID=A0ABW1PCY6_9PSEU
MLFERRQMSAMFDLRLVGGREVVIKAREDDGRATSCVVAQTRLADRGFPCPRPLTPALRHNARWEAVHGDEPVCGAAVRAQAAERLRLANA